MNAHIAKLDCAGSVQAAVIRCETEAQPASSGRLRLTPRGRVVFGALGTMFLVAVFAMFALFSDTQALASDTRGEGEYAYVIVQPGATLWEIAEALDPASDPRDLVSELVRFNQLDNAEIAAGETLAVPMRYSGAPGVAIADV